MEDEKLQNRPWSSYYSGISLNAPKHFVKVTIEDLKSYITELRKNGGNFTLSEYLKNTKFPDRADLVIADFSNLNLFQENAAELIDLRGANFFGSVFRNTNFFRCNLEGTSFAGLYLDNVTFKESNLHSVDFRGAILTNCHFAESYSYSPWNENKGIKVSSSSSCIRLYAEVKNDTAKKNEEQRLISNQKLELREMFDSMSFYSKLSYYLNLDSGESDKIAAYKNARAELDKMRKGIFNKNLIINKSFNHVFNAELMEFDPIVFTTEKESNLKLQKHYFPLSRADLNEYLQQLKTSEKSYSLNEFAERKYITSLKGDKNKINQSSNPSDLENRNVTQDSDKRIEPIVSEQAISLQAYENGLLEQQNIIADLSSKVNVFGNNEWNRLNFSGIDFSNCDLSNTSFSGCDLSRSIFKNSKLINTNFECTKMVDVIFNNVIGIECNFQNADLTKMVIERSNFQKANFSFAICNGAKIANSDLQYIDAYAASFKNVNLMSSNLSYSNLNKISLKGSNIADTILIHSFLGNANLENIKGSSVTFRCSYLKGSTLVNSIWYNSDFSESFAEGANLTGIKISEDCKFDKINLSESILDGIKSPNGKFRNAKFDKIKMGYGKLVGADFQGSTFRFADLNSCLFSEANCDNTDFTGATLYNLTFIKAQLKNSLFYGATLKNNDLTKADCENCDWQNIHISGSILNDTNNHRVRINDNSIIVDSVIKTLDGQFYHYDEDAFMNLMFIEQQQNLQKKIAHSEKILKWGSFGWALRFSSDEYAIPKQEVIRLANIRSKNDSELRSYTRKLKEDYRKNKQTNNDVYLFLLQNLISYYNQEGS